MFAWLFRQPSRRRASTQTLPAPRWLPDFDVLEDRTTPTVSTITGHFNGTAVPAGDSLWFSSVAKVSNLPAAGATVHVTGQAISFTAAGTVYTLNVPDTTVSLSPGTTNATVTTDGTGDWVVASPEHFSGNVFLSGLSVQLPAGLPGGVKNISWSGDFTADTAGVKVNWQWEAAAYRQLAGTDATALGVKPSDDKTAAYPNSDHAGTPEAFKQYVVGGATGGGGSNWTGGATGTASVSPNLAAVQSPASLSGVVQDGNGVAQAGIQVILTGTNTLGRSVSMTAVTDANGAYSFTGLQPGTYTLTIQPPATPAGESYNSTQFVTGQIDGQGTSATTYGTTSPGITLGSGDVATQFNFVNNYSSLG